MFEDTLLNMLPRINFKIDILICRFLGTFGYAFQRVHIVVEIVVLESDLLTSRFDCFVHEVLGLIKCSANIGF